MSEKCSEESRQYLKYITELNFSGYKFVLYYGEEMNEGIAEFPHHHYPYQIYYVLEGSIEIGIAGQIEEVPAQHCLFLAHNVQHHVFYTPDRPKRYFTMIYDIVNHEQEAANGPDGEMEYYDIKAALKLCDNRGYYISENPLHAASILEDLYKELEERAAGWNTMVVLHCYRFFIEALRLIAADPPKDKKFAGKENLAMAASMYIHNHYESEISVDKAAEALNVSPRHINRSYSNMFGTTFIKNANLLRIAYAKDYLCTTDDSIEEIAEKVGFASPRTFYKLFQQYEGISASQYRNLHRNK